MELLTGGFDPAAARRPAPTWSAGARLVVLALAGLAAGHGLELRGGLAHELGRALQTTAVHGGLLALGWLIACEGRPPWRRASTVVALTLAAASVLGRLFPWGALAYLLVPGAVVWQARSIGILRRAGVTRPADARPIVIGLAAGAFLGGHLLISASLTLGYPVRVGSPSGYLAAVAYDVGANACSAEWLFRGALFSRWWRAWSLWPAVAASTAVGLGRYLLDPLLPRTAEMIAGAVFYLALLGVSCALLRAWSGSLLPGYLAAVVFFAAYRALSVW